MHKKIGAALIRQDEAKSTIWVEEFDPPTWHALIRFQRTVSAATRRSRKDGPGLATCTVCRDRARRKWLTDPTHGPAQPLIVIIMSVAICPSMSPSVNACNARRSSRRVCLAFPAQLMASPTMHKESPGRAGALGSMEEFLGRPDSIPKRETR